MSDLRQQINEKWIEPCPFCGEYPRLDTHFGSQFSIPYGYSFHCRRCQYDFPIRSRYGNLVRNWNRRAP